MLNDSTQSGTKRSGKGRRSQLAEGPRRRYELDFKLQILKETFEPGASVAGVALRHGMNTNVIFRWRKEFREGQIGNGRLPAAGFLPIHVTEDAAPCARYRRLVSRAAKAQKPPCLRRTAKHRA
jgi:transposase-like protein